MILDRLKLLDPRRLFRKKEVEPKPEAEIPEPELLIEDEAIHPDKDPVVKFWERAVYWSFFGCYFFMVLSALDFIGQVRFDVDFKLKSGEPLGFSYDIGTDVNLLPLGALLAISFAVLLFAKGWVKYYAEENHKVAKRLALGFGLLSVVVVVLQTMTVNQEAKQEDFRTGLIAEEQVANQAAGTQALIALKREELARMQAKPSYQGLAASAGVESWAKKVRMTPRTDPDFRKIERAITDAEAADKLKGEIETMTVSFAQSTTKAEVKADVGSVMTDPVVGFMQAVTPFQKPLLALLSDMILIFGVFLGDIRRKRLLAEWNAAILRRKANAETESANAAQKPEEQKAQADPSATETGDPQSGTETEKPSPDPTQGEETPHREDGVEETTTTKTTTVETHERRVFQNKGRPATVEELKAAGLFIEEPANDHVERPEGSGDEPKASDGMDQGGMDQGGAGPDSVPPVSEADLGGGQSDLLNDEQPQMEDPAEAPEGPEQGTQESAGTEGDPARGNENEEAA